MGRSTWDEDAGEERNENVRSHHSSHKHQSHEKTPAHVSCKLQTEEVNRQIQSLIDYPSVVPHGGKSTVPPHLERGSLWDYFGEDERSVMQKRSHITDRQSRIETSYFWVFVKWEVLSLYFLSQIEVYNSWAVGLVDRQVTYRAQ